MATATSNADHITASIKEVPVTVRHPPPLDLDKYIAKPGVPRANKAVSKEKPDGDPRANTHATPIQQHVLFFDRDGDGVIYPWDTYVGFRRLGFNVLISFAAIFVIHGTFSFPTLPSWIPDIRFPIYINRMHRTKHGSDSEVYDTEGRFVPEKFEEIFSKFDSGNKGALSWGDIMTMVYENMNVMDPTGWIAERLEWWALWILCKDENNLLSKEKIRANYDGTLWDLQAAEVEAKKQAKRQAWAKKLSTNGKNKNE